MPATVAGEPIDVVIGPNGELKVNPLSQPKIPPGATWVPVRIVDRHPQWQAFRNQVLAYAAVRAGKAVYAPLMHPDLQDIPCWFGHDRLDAVIAHLAPGGRTVLDLGAHWGYACERLERAGWQCTAVESDAGAFRFMTMLRRAQRLSYSAVLTDVFDYVQKHPQADTVLALALFHHFLKTRGGCEALDKLLSQLQTNEIFLMTHDPHEPQMVDAYYNPEPEAFAELVSTNSGLSRYEQIGVFGGRPLFRIS